MQVEHPSLVQVLWLLKTQAPASQSLASSLDLAGVQTPANFQSNTKPKAHVSFTPVTVPQSCLYHVLQLFPLAHRSGKCQARLGPNTAEAKAANAHNRRCPVHPTWKPMTWPKQKMRYSALSSHGATKTLPITSLIVFTFKLGLGHGPQQQHSGALLLGLAIVLTPG